MNMVMSMRIAAPLRGWFPQETQTSALGGIAKASGLDDGVWTGCETIVKGKALGDATRTAGFLGGAQRSNPNSQGGRLLRYARNDME